MKTQEWEKFWGEFKKLPEIKPEIIKQKGLIGSGVIFALNANKMHKDEVVDTNYFYPSPRHYSDRGAGYYQNFVKTLYKHRDDYEYITAMFIQAACYDISRGHNFYDFLLFDISLSSAEKFGKHTSWIRNEHARYLHSVEDSPYLEDDCKNKLGHPLEIKTYKDAAEYIHNLMLNTFDNYQFVEVTMVEDSEREAVYRWTQACRNYRKLSLHIKACDNLTELYPCSSAAFDGTMKIRCSKHGDYSIKVDENTSANAHLCVECTKEAEALKAEIIRLKHEEKVFLQKESDINNFIAIASQKFDNFYDYSLVAEDFISLKEGKVRIIHPEYGVFEMTPDHHLRSLTGYCKSNVPNVPTAKEVKYILDGKGNKLSVGTKVKWQKSGKNKWYHGKVKALANSSVIAIDNATGSEVSKNHNFIFSEKELFLR